MAVVGVGPGRVNPEPGGGGERKREAVQKVVKTYVFRVLVMQVMHMTLNSASLYSIRLLRWCTEVS